MKQIMALVLAAVVAGLAACEIASNEGIRGIPANLNMWLSGEKTPLVEAAVSDAAQEKAEEVVAKVKEAAEKAVDAAKPAGLHEAVQEGVPGETHYYGASTTAVSAAWNAEATMNPDYTAAQTAAAETPAEEPAAEAPAAAAEESAEHPPAALGEAGTLSFFGATEKSDTDQPWAAAATVFEQVAAVETPAPAAEEAPAEEAAVPAATGGDATLSFFGATEKSDTDQPWAAAATVFEQVAVAEAPAAAEESAEHPPAALGEAGTLSFFGATEKSDTDQAWAAAATVFERVAVAEAPAAAEESVEHPPAALGEAGTLSFFGAAEKSDADQPWAAAASINSNYKVAAAAPAAEAEVEKAVSGCREALTGVAQQSLVTFSMGSWKITSDNYGTIDKIARLAKDCAGLTIEVAGHADDTGKASFNQTLSELRAKAVVRYLKNEGVDAGRLKAVGYGQDKPIADNDTRKGRAKNRRTEFSVSAE